METRGRKSAASLSVVPLALIPRLEPRDNLAPDPAAIFCEIVANCDPTHFKASDLPLLEEYAVAIAQARKAGEMLARHGPLGYRGKVSPWVVLQEKSSRQIVALSHQLRSSPQSRYDAHAAARKAGSLTGLDRAAAMGMLDD